MSVSEKYSNLKKELTNLTNEANKNEWLRKYSEEAIKDLQIELENNKLNVVVFGEFKSGKSTFLNALLGKRILPEAVTRYTAIVTEVYYSQQNTIEIAWVNKAQLNDRIKSLLGYIINRLELEESLSKDVNSLKELIEKIQGGGSKEEIYKNIHQRMKKIGRDNAYKICSADTKSSSLNFLDLWNVLDDILSNYSHHKENILEKNKIEKDIPLKKLDDFVAYNEVAKSKCLFINKAKVYRNMDFLSDGITLVDLPGTGISFDDTKVALDYGTNAHLVLALTPADTPLSKSDKEYLLQLKKNRDNRLDHLLMFVNRIDQTKQNFQPKEETYKARYKIIKDIELALKNYDIESMDVVAISAKSALLAKNAKAKGEMGRGYNNIVKNFTVVDDDDDQYNIPEPDDFLTNVTPYNREKGGVSWYDAEDKLITLLVNNRGKIILKEINSKLESICKNGKMNIKEIQNELKYNLNEITNKMNNIKKIIKDLNDTKNAFKEWCENQDPIEYKSDVINIRRKVRKRVVEKIYGSDLGGKNLHRHLYDELETWIIGSTKTAMNNLQHTKDDIKFLTDEYNKRLREYGLKLQKIKIPVDIEKEITENGKISSYQPQFIPKEERVTRDVWDPKWYNPFTWLRKKTIVINEGRPEEYIYKTKRIKNHYENQIDAYLNKLKPNIEKYCKMYYEESKEKLLEKGFAKIKKKLSDKIKNLVYLKEQVSKTKKEKKETEDYLESQKEKIISIINRSDNLNNEIEKLKESLEIK